MPGLSAVSLIHRSLHPNQVANEVRWEEDARFTTFVVQVVM